MRAGRQSFFAEHPIYLRSSYTIVGPKEGDGNFGDRFDTVLPDDLWGERSYEKAESKMHREAVRGAVCLAGCDADGIDVCLAGDLLNEISASGLAMRYFKSPFLGLYNACATFAEAVIVGSALIDCGMARTAACSSSSHFASAERQYRYPLELGNQRTPTSQWTVTGAGCSVLSSVRPTPEGDEACRTHFKEKMKAMRDECMRAASAEDSECGKGGGIENPFAKRGGDALERMKHKLLRTLRPASLIEPDCDLAYRRTHIVKITGGTLGKVTDFGIDDESNMGGAMAPAAADTLIAHLEDTGRTPGYYDAIVTGDLGRFGTEAFCYLLSKEGITLDNHFDCGAGFFKPEQKTFQGGSGAGCVNVVFNGHIAKRMERGELGRVLVIATGALLNKDTPLQKENIPGIAHAFTAESEPYV